MPRKYLLFPVQNPYPESKFRISLYQRCAAKCCHIHMYSKRYLLLIDITFTAKRVQPHMKLRLTYICPTTGFKPH